MTAKRPRIVVYVDAETRRRVKVRAAQLDLSASELCLRYIEQGLRSERPPAGPPPLPRVDRGGV